MSRSAYKNEIPPPQPSCDRREFLNEPKNAVLTALSPKIVPGRLRPQEQVPAPGIQVPSASEGPELRDAVAAGAAAAAGDADGDVADDADPS